jgi:hypothetical protein
MKMTLKEFKELVGKDKEMNEGFIDSLRKKFGKQEQPKEEFIENYTRFYEDLKDFEKIVEFDRKEKYYLDMIGEQLLSIKEFQNRRDLKPENKNLGVKNGLESIEKIYLPELLQMLANHHPKQFKQKFHSDVLKFYKITVPEVTTKTTRISPRYFPNAIEQMITFAKQKGYSNQYMQKLEQLKNLAEHLKHGYLENPKALAGKEAEVSNFVETIKKILASWRRKYGADYNKMISPELKEFGLNEQSFKKNIKEEGETRKPTMADFAKFIGYEGQEEKIRMVKTIVDMSDSDGAYTTFEDEGDEDATGIIEAIWFDYGSWGEAIKAFNKEFRDSQNMG